MEKKKEYIEPEILDKNFKKINNKTFYNKKNKQKNKFFYLIFISLFFIFFIPILIIIAII
ncbi:MAG: hypothetical protein LRZ98_00290 [Candidatus Pacebacteria bacterium]|nr:hypothetical protein [Candidatus Paceibacterota bacterium]